MSTRSGVGFPTDTGFQIKYVHSDGYPAGVGWSIIQNHQHMSIAEMRAFLFETHRGSFSALAGADWRKPCGFAEYKNLPVWSGPDKWTEEAIHEHYTHPRCYCHGDRSENRNGAEQLIMTWSAIETGVANTFRLVDGLHTTGLEYVHLIQPNGIMEHAVLEESGWGSPNGESHLILSDGVFVPWDNDYDRERWDDLATVLLQPLSIS